MLKVFQSWIERYFSSEETVIFMLLLAIGFIVILLWGDILAPVIASIIIAFVLQGLVNFLVDRGANSTFSIIFAYMLFASVLVAIVTELIPLVWSQAEALVRDAPQILESLRATVVKMQDEYPNIINAQLVERVSQEVSAEVTNLGQWLVSQSIESLPVLIQVLIHCVVVPLLVFFFLKDRVKILSGLASLLPSERPLMSTVWDEMNEQFANYVRGKVVEIVVVGFATYVAFAIIGLNYTVLLAILVGLSVVIPYIGAVIVTIPVTMIALFQFGLAPEFYYLMIAYFVIQALDGNLLVPLLFSEVNNLHPVVIIVAVLFFGGLWGVWGVFFAIPLATMCKAIVSAWPHHVST